MTKRKLIYDPEKNYELADFQNTTIKNLYAIGKKIGIRDVKKPKKNVLAQLILEKHNQIPIVNNLEETQPSAGIVVFGDLLNKIVKEVPFSLIDMTQWFHANTVSKYLQYKNYSSAIYKHVSDCNKMNFEKLKMNGGSTSMQYQATTIFINEHGVAELIKKIQLSNRHRNTQKKV